MTFAVQEFDIFKRLLKVSFIFYYMPHTLQLKEYMKYTTSWKLVMKIKLFTVHIFNLINMNRPIAREFITGFRNYNNPIAITSA